MQRQNQIFILSLLNPKIVNAVIGFQYGIAHDIGGYHPLAKPEYVVLSTHNLLHRLERRATGTGLVVKVKKIVQRVTCHQLISTGKVRQYGRSELVADPIEVKLHVILGQMQRALEHVTPRRPSVAM